jgi:hypothetical protein
LQSLTAGHLAHQICASQLHPLEPIQFRERLSLQPTPVRKVADFFGPAQVAIKAKNEAKNQQVQSLRATARG